MPAAKRNRFIDIAAPLVSLALLAGIVVERSRRQSPGDAEPYHKSIRAVADQIPFHIGDWNGVDQEVAPAAMALLRPNVIISRYYHNSRGIGAGFLLVHCRDARDIAGHYPPVCYPAHGHTQKGAAPWDFEVEGLKITGTRYDFSRSAFTHTINSVVYDFIVMPNGSIVRDMQAVRAAAGSYIEHFLGAGQIQVIFDANVSVADQEEALRALLGASREIIQTIRLGIKHER